MPRLSLLVFISLAALTACSGSGDGRVDERADLRTEVRGQRLALQRDELLGFADDDFHDCVWGALVDFIHHDDSSNELGRFRSLTPALQAYWSTQLVEFEVGDGGFNQYFFNSSRDYAAAAIDGFDLFGLSTHADLMRRAIAIADSPSERSLREDAHREGSFEGFGDTYGETSFNSFDEEFYALPPPLGAGVAFLRSHIDDVTVGHGPSCAR